MRNDVIMRDRAKRSCHLGYFMDALPLGEGIIVDPFMGSGSTVAASEAIGVCCIGIERYFKYYNMSRIAIPKLTNIEIRKKMTEQLVLPLF